MLVVSHILIYPSNEVVAKRSGIYGLIFTEVTAFSWA